jgi:large exoprotein involved in heme utilization and adhesion
LVEAQNLKMTGGSNIFSTTQGTGKGGNLTVNVEAEILSDGNLSGFYTNSILTASGSAGDIIGKSKSLIVSNGAQINSIANINTTGNSGNIAIIVDNIKITGAAAVPSVTPSVISTETKGAGNAGDLTIITDQLQVLSGGQVITSTNQGGNAGQLTIQASDIQVVGVARSSTGQFLTKKNADGNNVRLSSSITANTEPKSTGKGANVNITTDRLTVRDGAVIQSATFGSGAAGNIAIIAKESIRLEGVAPTPDDPFPSSIIAFSGGIPNKNVLSVPEATGKGGNITIDTPKLQLTDGALIALGSLNATATAQGAGELLKITADVISLDRAELNAETNFGNGGNMNLTANQLLILRNGSKITTQSGIAQKSGNAGNIEISAPFIFAIANENSDINANAFTGKGGNVKLTAQSGRILGLEKRLQPTALSDITASSQNGVQGTITIANPDIDPDRGTVPLPTTTRDPANRIDQSCRPNSSVSSQFTIVGNSGLPTTPQTRSVTAVLARLATLPEETARRSPPVSNTSKTIREAQRIRRLANGKIRFLVNDIDAMMLVGLNNHCQ